MSRKGITFRTEAESQKFFDRLERCIRTDLLSKEELSLKLGHSRGWLSQITTGEHRVTVDGAQQLADYFGVELKEFLYGKPEPKEEEYKSVITPEEVEIEQGQLPIEPVTPSSALVVNNVRYLLNARSESAETACANAGLPVNWSERQENARCVSIDSAYLWSVYLGVPFEELVATDIAVNYKAKRKAELTKQIADMMKEMANL